MEKEKREEKKKVVIIALEITYYIYQESNSVKLTTRLAYKKLTSQ